MSLFPPARASHHQELPQTRLHGEDWPKGMFHRSLQDLGGPCPSGLWGRIWEGGKWGSGGWEDGREVNQCV